MTDWKAIAHTYALAFNKMREAFEKADYNNGDLDATANAKEAYILLSSIPPLAIVELSNYEQPAPQPSAPEFATAFEWREDHPDGKNWYRRDAPDETT